MASVTRNVAGNHRHDFRVEAVGEQRSKRTSLDRHAGASKLSRGNLSSLRVLRREGIKLPVLHISTVSPHRNSVSDAVFQLAGICQSHNGGKRVGQKSGI